jgi:hypothetical protein
MRNAFALPAVGLPALGLLTLCLLTLSLLTLSLGATAALAQSAGPDEAVQPNGAVTQQLALTAGQKSAIYNAVVRQRLRPRADQISVSVGAPVPPFVELIDLPDQASAGNALAAVLKYAMVENDVVVIDPVVMRVVDVIRGGARP